MKYVTFKTRKHLKLEAQLS